MEDISTHMRGVNSILLRKWLLQRFGEETLDKINAKISPEACKMLKNPVPNEWYPSSLTKEIYEIIDDELSPEYPDALRDFGRFSAEQSIRGFLRFLTRFLTVPQLFKRAQAFWKSYNKGGSIETGAVTEEGGRKRSTVIIRGSGVGAPGCKVLEGFIEVLMAQTGAHNIEVEKKTCIHKGDKVCSWEVSWED
jgi:predicted hydrocarbon binding protein